MKFVEMNDEMRGRVTISYLTLPPGRLKQDVSVFTMTGASRIPTAYLEQLGIDYSDFEVLEDLGAQPDRRETTKSLDQMLLGTYKRKLGPLALKMEAGGLNFKEQPDNLGISRFSVLDVMISTLTFGCFGFVMALNRDRPLWQRLVWMTGSALFGMVVDMALWGLKARKAK